MTSPESLGSRSNEWQAEQLRATVFFLPDVHSGLAQQWWTNVVGGSPDEERSRAQEGTIQQFGRVLNSQINVLWRSDRVDWRLVPNVARLSEPAVGLLSLGAYPEIWPDFLELSIKGLAHVPESIRVAFGAVLFKPVDDLREGYDKLAQYLPNVELSFGNATDFLYQINRFRNSQEDETLVINRLTKWSIFLGGAVGISLSPERSLVVPSALPPQHACRLELDISTAPLASPVAADVTSGLFRELVSLGTEITVQGDVP